MISNVRDLTLGLRARYTLSILALVTSVVLIISVALIVEFRASAHRIHKSSVHTTSQELLGQLVERGTIMTETLADNLANPLDKYDIGHLSRLLHTILDQQDVVDAYIVDASGKILHDGTVSVEGFGEVLHAPAVQDTLQTGLPSNLVDSELVHLAEAIQKDNSTKLLGAVYLTLSRSGTNQLIDKGAAELTSIVNDGLRWNLYTAILTGLFIVMIGVGVAVQFARNLADPISRLAHIARQIGDGEYPDEIGFRRKDELGELASAFNEMSKKLQSTTESMRFMAYHDTLTGLPNRAMFQELLNTSVENSIKYETQGALMFIDLDHFKRINDTLGHQAGDSLLCEVAARLYKVAREEEETTHINSQYNSSIARLGGDEFTVLLPKIDHSMDASLIARRMLKALKEPYILLDQPVVISASIGITIFPTDSSRPTELLKNADLALYHSKDKGRNAYHFFDNTMNRSILNKMEIEREMRSALENEEFELHYQCQIASKSNQAIGAEALIRWRHPTKGLISPGEFIPIAEETGLINEIGRWALIQAARDVAWWRKHGQRHFYVAVNASAVQLRQPSFIDDVKAALNKYQLDSDAMHIEITESSLMENESSSTYIMNELQELGVEVWMDDFGTGYSSLSYLRRFAFSGVKIDYSFVQNIVEDAGDRAIISAIIAMAASLNIQVTAEGVETDQQSTMLAKAKCDRLQGFYFSYPLPMADFVRSFVHSPTIQQQENEPPQLKKAS